MKKWIQISWLDVPEYQDYPAAESYLSLIFQENRVQECISLLKESKISYFKAKDIFRASKLSLLWISNSHIKKDQIKIKKKIALSPLLLVRDNKSSAIIIADGYHRLCAVYGFDEDAIIPCKIVD